MHKNEPLPELYSADAFARDYNRVRCAKYFLSTCFFPDAKRAAMRGDVSVTVLSVKLASIDYLDTLATLLGMLGWITYEEKSETEATLIALLPV